MVESRLIDTVIADFSSETAAIETTFGLDSASEIVSAVLRGCGSRNGNCDNGWEYFVHGFGYTVVLPTGGQVHFDGSNEGDFFTKYDLAFFLESDERFKDPDDPAVGKMIADMCARRKIRCLPDGRYGLPVAGQDL